MKKDNVLTRRVNKKVPLQWDEEALAGFHRDQVKLKSRQENKLQTSDNSPQ